MNVPISVARNITVALFALGAVLWATAAIWNLIADPDGRLWIYSICAITTGLIAISLWRDA